MNAIEQLDREQRRRCAIHWALRGQAEQRAGDAFAAVAEDLRALRAPDTLIAAAARSIAQEGTHAEVCRQVAAAYDREAAAGVDALPVARDTHDEGSAWRVQHVVGFCCISETFASAYLAGSRAAATVPLARAALHLMLADEIGHGQLGWAFLASPAAPAAATVAGLLAPMLAAYDGYVRARVADYPDVDLAAHGCPSPRALPGQFLAAVDELILPGFQQLGIETTAGRRWLRDARARG